MALPQDRYVKIISSNEGDPEVPQRDLSGLVFTKGVLYNGTKSYDKLYDFHSATEVSKAFGSTSVEAAFAARYFGYVSPSATAPQKLSFAFLKENEKPGAAFDRVCDFSGNFGSFCFLDSGWEYENNESGETWSAPEEAEFSVSDLKTVAEKNAALNYKFLFSVAIVADKDEETGAYSAENAKEAAETIGGTDGVNGTALMQGADPFSAACPMAMFAATDYDSVNAATDNMFKQIDGETPTVTSTSDADDLDGLNVNYYGLVQINGRQRAFYQTGVNLDGEATPVYCNEVWLKSAISTEILNLALTVERIPYNRDGESLIYNTVASVAEQGCTNGVILLAKRLTNRQKNKIYQLTSNADAWFSVEDAGYWLDVKLKENPKKEGQYMAVYRLIYSKGDAIHYFEGHDILI